jgi:hypothetical protein
MGLALAAKPAIVAQAKTELDKEIAKPTNRFQVKDLNYFTYVMALYERKVNGYTAKAAQCKTKVCRIEITHGTDPAVTLSFAKQPDNHWKIVEVVGLPLQTAMQAGTAAQ